jgi:hypothetical protein
MAFDVCALKGQDRKARGALSTPGRRSQGGSCTPTGYDRRRREARRGQGAKCGHRPTAKALGYEAGDRTPLGYKTLPGSSDPGCSAHPGLCDLALSGHKHRSPWPRSRCALSDRMPAGFPTTEKRMADGHVAPRPRPEESVLRSPRPVITPLRGGPLHRPFGPPDSKGGSLHATLTTIATPAQSSGPSRTMFVDKSGQGRLRGPMRQTYDNSDNSGTGA